MEQILFLGLERDNLLINLEAKRHSHVDGLPEITLIVIDVRIGGLLTNI